MDTQQVSRDLPVSPAKVPPSTPRHRTKAEPILSEDSARMIAEYIARHGVTKCSPKYAVPTGVTVAMSRFIRASE